MIVEPCFYTAEASHCNVDTIQGEKSTISVRFTHPYFQFFFLTKKGPESIAIFFLHISYIDPSYKILKSENGGYLQHTLREMKCKANVSLMIVKQQKSPGSAAA